MLWIIVTAAVALAALVFALRKWASSADDFWDTVQVRADERDQEVAAQKQAKREERQRRAAERAAAAAAKAEQPAEQPAEQEARGEVPTEAAATFTDVGPSEAVKLIAHRHDLTILDVRTPGETAAGVIEHALLIPMDQLQGRLGELPDGPLLVYCAVGARSAAVAEFLVGSGRDEVFNLDGGIMAWGGKVVRPA